MTFKVNSGVGSATPIVGFDVTPKPLVGDLAFLSLDDGITWFSLAHGQGVNSGWKQQDTISNVVGTILGSPPFAFASVQSLNSTVLIRYVVNGLGSEYTMTNGPIFTKL